MQRLVKKESRLPDLKNSYPNYHPSLLLRNGHVNTIFTSLTRKVEGVTFSRERIKTHDGDFIDLDFIKNKNPKIAILCHGLEGSSSSKYILGTSKLLTQNGFDICAMNYRFCSGHINSTPQLYHSGYTIDLNSVVQHVLKDYEEIHLIGFSLGGNLVLKYVGDHKFTLSKKIKSTSAISVPMELHSASLKMLRFQNLPYTKRFLKTLFEKLKQKHEQFPLIFDLTYVDKVKNVLDFDEYYTGPLNGFTGAVDYYTQCSSKQFLHQIAIPTLIINAQDDPFISKECFPSLSEIGNKNITTFYPKYGGHVGFYRKQNICWDEEIILQFLNSLI